MNGIVTIQNSIFSVMKHGHIISPNLLPVSFKIVRGNSVWLCNSFQNLNKSKSYPELDSWENSEENQSVFQNSTASIGACCVSMSQFPVQTEPLELVFQIGKLYNLVFSVGLFFLFLIA